jgi:hypothetical protein
MNPYLALILPEMFLFPEVYLRSFLRTISMMRLHPDYLQIR